jgi:ribosomal protein L17
MPDPELIEQVIADARVDELELVRETIADPGRAQAFISLLEERDRLLERFAEQHSTHKQLITELSRDYQAERGEFEALLATFNRNRDSAQKELIELVARMKQATNTEEWRKISAFQTKRLNLRQIVYRETAAGA